MQVFRTLAGYSLGRADIVRRAMAKKKHDVMRREREFFLYGEKDGQGNVLCEGAINRGVPETVAEKIFDDMSAFSSYAFNKSHAAAYSVVAYRTAYLKCHYPAEYFAALMTSMLDSTGKISLYTAECRKMGIKILPPSVNKSEAFFTPDNGNIRFGLLAVKNLGRGIIDRLIAERANGEYTSMYDFCKRNYGREFNRRALEGLIKSGALDGLEDNRRQMLYGIDGVLSAVENEKRFSGAGQLDMFGEMGTDMTFRLEPAEEMPKDLLLAMEKESTGLYMSGHPMDDYKRYTERAGMAKSSDIIARRHRDGKRVSVAGVIGNLKVRQLKNNNLLASAVIEDIYGSVEVTVFANAYGMYKSLLTSGSPIILSGRISEMEDRDPEIICERVERIPESAKNTAGELKYKSGLYLKVKNTDCEEFGKVREFLKKHHGSTPVYIYCTETGRKLEAPESLRVNAQDAIISLFGDIIGKENVKLIK